MDVIKLTGRREDMQANLEILRARQKMSLGIIAEAVDGVGANETTVEGYLDTILLAVAIERIEKALNDSAC